MNPVLREVQAVMSTLFHRYPMLCGFSVKDDLSFAEIACHPAMANDDAMVLAEDISAALHDLLDERPEAADLLRGRTLARTFH